MILDFNQHMKELQAELEGNLDDSFQKRKKEKEIMIKNWLKFNESVESKEIDMAKSFLQNNDLEVKDINSGNEGHDLGKKFKGVSDPGSDKTAFIWNGDGWKNDGKEAFYVYMPFDEEILKEMKEKFPVLSVGGRNGTYYEVTIEKK